MAIELYEDTSLLPDVHEMRMFTVNEQERNVNKLCGEYDAKENDN